MEARAIKMRKSEKKITKYKKFVSGPFVEFVY